MSEGWLPKRTLSAFGSSDRLLDQNAYCASNCLWRLSEGPDERTPHPLAISKTVLTGEFLSGEAAGLHHQPRRFHAQLFDCLREWPSRYLSKQLAELPGAKKGGLRQVITRQPVAQAFSCISEWVWTPLDVASRSYNVEYRDCLPELR
jgi:hypothetical protein